MFIRILILLAVFLLVDLYFFQALKTIAANWPEGQRLLTFRIYWGFTVFSLAFALFSLLTYEHPVLPKFLGLYVFCFIFVVVVSKLLGSTVLLVEDIQRLIRAVVAFFQKGTAYSTSVDGISRARFLSYASVSLAAVPFVSMVYGMVKTAFDFTIRRQRVTLANLPEGFEGLKIVQISDIHSGSFYSGESFERAVEMILAEKPDVIFFTGDLVNDRSSEVEPFMKIWEKLVAPLGVFSIVGNHDYGDYVQWDSAEEKAANFSRLKEIHKEMGWDLLLNEHRVLERNGHTIGLLGVENWGRTLRFPRKGDIHKAKAGMPEVPVTLLLSHDPSHWEAQVTTDHPDIDITFSGHTHGFQFGIEIPGFKWSPSQYVYAQWAGLYTQKHQHIYVNRGLGFLGYLGRVGIKPEITVIELFSKA